MVIGWDYLISTETKHKNKKNTSKEVELCLHSSTTEQSGWIKTNLKNYVKPKIIDMHDLRLSIVHSIHMQQNIYIYIYEGIYTLNIYSYIYTVVGDYIKTTFDFNFAFYQAFKLYGYTKTWKQREAVN